MLDFKTLCIWIFSRVGSAVKDLLLLVSELSTGHWWLFFCYLSIPVYLSLSDMCKWVLWHKGMAYRDIMYMLPGFTFHEGHIDEGTKFGMNFICRLHDFLRCHPRITDNLTALKYTERVEQQAFGSTFIKLCWHLVKQGVNSECHCTHRWPCYG